MATGNTTLQLAAAPEMRGRVMSLWFVAFQGSTPIGGPLLGWAMGWAGARVGLGVGGVACLVVAGIGILAGRHRPTLAPMRAATIRDGAIVVDEHPDPTPGAGEVLVRVRAAGLNGADMIQVAGGYPPPPGHARRHPRPRARGRGRRARPGRDAASPRATASWASPAAAGQAELATVHERQLMPVPDVLDWEAAGGVPEAFTTAHDAIFTQARPARRRAPARARRGGRRRHGRRAARPRGRARA